MEVTNLSIYLRFQWIIWPIIRCHVSATRFQFSKYVYMTRYWGRKKEINWVRKWLNLQIVFDIISFTQLKHFLNEFRFRHVMFMTLYYLYLYRWRFGLALTKLNDSNCRIKSWTHDFDLACASAVYYFGFCVCMCSFFSYKYSKQISKLAIILDNLQTNWKQYQPQSILFSFSRF